MASLPSSTAVQVESIVFPPSVKPPGTAKTLFLAGAGVRCLEIQGNSVKFTATGVYLEDKAIPLLAVKWKGKTAAELADSDDFCRDIVTGPFEKVVQIAMIIPVTGKQFSEKFITIWKAHEAYTDADSTSAEKFLEVFKEESFPPGASTLFTLLPLGSLMIGFVKDGVIPTTANAVIENEKLGQVMLEGVIGKHGVSPATNKSVASRLSDLMNQSNEC